MCSPSAFYHKQSRFYYYKIQEYSDFSRVKEDIVWRKLGDIEEHLLAVAWVPLERIIEIAYQDFDFPAIKAVREFFAERNLLVLQQDMMKP